MLDKLTYEDFQQYLNDWFVIYYDAASKLEVRLARVDVVGKPQKEGWRSPFSLVFASKLRDRYLVQAMYRFGHEKMGEFDIFITPLGPDSDGMNYEAVFS